MLEIVVAGVVFGILVWGVSGNVAAGALTGGVVACLILMARLEE